MPQNPVVQIVGSPMVVDGVSWLLWPYNGSTGWAVECDTGGPTFIAKLNAKMVISTWPDARQHPSGAVTRLQLLQDFNRAESVVGAWRALEMIN